MNSYKLVRAGFIVIMLVMIQLAACGGGNSEEPANTAKQISQVSNDESEQNRSGSLSTGPFSLEWEITKDNITFTLTAETTGWIAMGIDPVRSMLGADFTIGFVSDGEVFVEDHYGNNRYSHQPDVDGGGTSDIFDISGSESGGSTIISFSKPLDTGDERDKVIEPGETYTLILAHGDNDEDDFRSQHTAEALTEISL
jgi:hypothetical protein